MTRSILLGSAFLTRAIRGNAESSPPQEIIKGNEENIHFGLRWLKIV